MTWSGFQKTHSLFLLKHIIGRVVVVKRQEIEQHCTELVTPIIEQNGFELVDVEYVKEGSDYYLRVYADKEGGIDINDCVFISRSLEEKLDEADKLTDPYILEVSSPGLTRPLKKEKDFKRSLGKKVEVKLYRALDGCKEFEAVLTGYTDTTISLLPDGAKEEKEFSKSDISMIRLAFE